MVLKKILDNGGNYNSSSSSSSGSSRSSHHEISMEPEEIPLMPLTDGEKEELEPLLHLAAAACDLLKLKRYLEEAANNCPLVLSSKDLSRKNRNILHHSAAYIGNSETSNNAVKLILSYVKDLHFYSDLVNGQDEDGNTPLYLAAKFQNENTSRSLLYGESDLDIPNNRGKTPIIKLFCKIPCIMAEIFNQAERSSYFLNPERSYINLYLRTLVSQPTDEDIRFKSNGLYREMDLLSNVSFTPEYQRTQLLTNTHLKILVWLKWENYKWIFWITRFIQIIWCLTYFIFILTFYRVNCPFPIGKVYNFSWFISVPSTVSVNYTDDVNSLPLFSERECGRLELRVMGWILLASALLDLILVEAYPTTIRFQRKWYSIKTISLHKFIKHGMIFIRILHLEKLLFLLSIFINTIPINFEIDLLPVQWQYVFAAIGIFFAWFQIFLQLGKFPQFKGYIKMLTNTIRTLCIVGTLYISLVFAFAMVFCILLPGEVTYSSPLEAIARMSTFTIGEADFEDTFYGEDASYPASFLLTVFFFAVAIIILHIALLNFLIGLTINQLEDVWSQAENWRIYTYLWQIFLCENFISNFSKFPWAKKFLQNRRLLPTNFKQVPIYQEKFFAIRVTELPKDLRKEIRALELDYIGNV